VHEDPIAPVLLGLIVLFVSAKVGGFFATKFKQPAVLGELLAGVAIGNIFYMGVRPFDFILHGSIFSIMSSLGVILLLFEVGLESNLKDLLKVGPLAMLVACVGVVVPMAMGIGVNGIFYPEESIYRHLFVGAVLCATSVGITARVLKDLGKLQSKEAKIILGAAVIDDVLGLVILAVVAGMITAADAGNSASFSLLSVAWITGKAVGFLCLSLFLGVRYAPHLFKFGAGLKMDGVLVTLSLTFCFFLSYLAYWVGLAPIVGAFAAGLVIDGTGFARFFPEQEHSIEELIFPLSKFFVPIFFVHMGMQVDISTFLDRSVLVFAIALSVVAIIGKQVCGLVIFGKQKKGINRKVIGLGMIPRGEVGLIFAAMGSQLYLMGKPVIDAGHYSAILLMVFLTTLMTPFSLKWALSKK
jgi:Kef-type K+ transport system membrane component KefB